MCELNNCGKFQGIIGNDFEVYGAHSKTDNLQGIKNELIQSILKRKFLLKSVQVHFCHKFIVKIQRKVMHFASPS